MPEAGRVQSVKHDQIDSAGCHMRALSGAANESSCTRGRWHPTPFLKGIFSLQIQQRAKSQTDVTLFITAILSLLFRLCIAPSLFEPSPHRTAQRGAAFQIAPSLFEPSPHRTAQRGAALHFNNVVRCSRPLEDSGWLSPMIGPSMSHLSDVIGLSARCRQVSVSHCT
jgi:hypothetical protein